MGKENSRSGLAKALYNPISNGAVASPSGRFKEKRRPYVDEVRIISNSTFQRDRDEHGAQLLS